MFTNTKFIMLAVLLAAGNAAAHVAVSSSAGPSTIPIVTTSSSSAASTSSYITPTPPSSTGYPGGPSGGQHGGLPSPPNGGAFPSGAPNNGQGGGNGGPEHGAPGGSAPGGGSTGSPNGGSPHGPIPSGTPSKSGLPGGHPIPPHFPRQNTNRPFPSSGSQSSDITAADNSTFLPNIVAYYTPPFTVRGLSTVKNATQGQELIEFITDNGGQRDGDWWKVSTADFVYHIQSYTTTIGGTVYNLTAVPV